jgi:hypothetical protein
MYLHRQGGLGQGCAAHGMVPPARALSPADVDDSRQAASPANHCHLRRFRMVLEAASSCELVCNPPCVRRVCGMAVFNALGQQGTAPCLGPSSKTLLSVGCA